MDPWSDDSLFEFCAYFSRSMECFYLNIKPIFDERGKPGPDPALVNSVCSQTTLTVEYVKSSVLLVESCFDDPPVIFLLFPSVKFLFRNYPYPAISSKKFSGDSKAKSDPTSC